MQVLEIARRLSVVTLFIFGPSLVPADAVEPGESAPRVESAWTEVHRESVYIPARDGILLAADIFRPARENGEVASDELPVIWTLQRYHRVRPRDGRLVTIIESRYPWLEKVILAGYAAVIVDARGTGASQGVRPVELGELDALDAYDVTEWLAAQDWSRGKIGMYGRSFRGMTQYLAAGTSPPHLRAIFPEMAMYDAFDTAYRQGVPLRMFEAWGAGVSRLDAMAGVPPDSDPQGEKLEGWMERRAEGNQDVAGFAERTVRRDMADPVTGVRWSDVSPARFVPQIRRGDVAVHHLVGWLDTWVDDAIAWFQALEGAESVPQKLTIGPWPHTGREGLDFADEHLRWYERWLLGDENGVMDEPPIRYATSDLEGRVTWSTADSWPPASVETSPLHLVGDAARGLGELRAAPIETTSVTTRTADYEASSGKTSRWTNAVGGPFGYGDLSANDARGFVWQTEALQERTVVTGQAVAHLWVSSTEPDADLFVYLEEVDESGASHYVTEGMARASVVSGGKSLNEGPVEMEARLMATSWAFTPGHRIRLTVTFADRDNARGLTHDPAPEMRMHMGTDAPSWVELPIRPTER